MKLSLKKHQHSSLGKPQDSFVDRLSTDPYLDWFLIVLGSSIVAMIGVVAGIFVYVSVTTELNTPTTVTPQVRSVFDAQLLSSTLESFAARATERAAIVSGSITIPGDPSL